MPSMVMRDSSKDYRTYWIRDGLYYGVDRGLGAMPCTLPKDKIAGIPEDDRTILLEETDADPDFCRQIAALMAKDPDWVHTISRSAKAAAENELNPAKGRKGGWPKLRARVRELLAHVASQAVAAARQLTPEQRFYVIKQLAGGKPALKKPSVSGLGDLGQWDIIGALVGNLVSAGAGVYGSVVTADAQKDLAKLQANSAMQNAQAQMAIANANAAIASAQAQISSPISSAVSALTSGTVAGIPVIIPISLAAAVALYFALGRKR